MTYTTVVRCERWGHASPIFSESESPFSQIQETHSGSPCGAGSNIRFLQLHVTGMLFVTPLAGWGIRSRMKESDYLGQAGEGGDRCGSWHGFL